MGKWIEQRNEQINEMITEYKVCHDSNFPEGRSMTDEEWHKAVDDFDSVATKYKDTNFGALSGKLCMAFLDDIEYVHKKWLEKGK